MSSELRRTGENLLASIAGGDAAGVPVETKSYIYIANKYGRIDKLIPTTDNLYFKGEWPVGKTSDDTAESASLARGLIRANGFDLPILADEHLKTFLATPDTIIIKNGSKMIKKLGYGSSTSNSMLRIASGESPFTSGELGGNGNGVIMKMAALAYWQYVRCISDKERYRQYDAYTTMTHDSDVARVATRVHGDVLYNLLLQDYTDYTEYEFGNQAYDIALYHERAIGTANHDVSSSLEYLQGLNWRDNELLLAEIEGLYADRAVGVTDKEFGRSYGFYVPETLAISYGSFILGRGDYSETVYTAVNLGGDADSTASISGAMVNFLRKGEQKLLDDMDKIQDLDQLNKLSRQLAERALAI